MYNQPKDYSTTSCLKQAASFLLNDWWTGILVLFQRICIGTYIQTYARPKGLTWSLTQGVRSVKNSWKLYCGAFFSKITKGYCTSYCSVNFTSHVVGLPIPLVWIFFTAVMLFFFILFESKQVSFPLVIHTLIQF